LLLLATLLLPSESLATIITYDAASGVLPSDLSIPPESRFEELGAEFGFSSVSNGVLSIEDTSTIDETDFQRTTPPVTSTTVAAYQIEMKVLSSIRPTLNLAGAVGFVDGLKSVRLFLLPDRVGFGSDTALWHYVLFDTTDDFHSYRVLKDGNNTIQLFIDDTQTPVLEFPYSDLANVTPTQVFTYLWQGSNPGRSHVEIKSFAYNTSGLTLADCNTNGVADDQDIAAGTSQDCNVNTIPDECDIAAGTSPDCDSNGIPNDCIICNSLQDCDDCDAATTDGCFRNRCIRLAACSIGFVPGDMDRDGDLDLEDFAIMSLCFSGSDGVIPQSCPFGGGAGLP